MLDAKQMKDMEYFVGALLVGESVRNTIHLSFFVFFSFFNSQWTGFRKIIFQDWKVVVIVSVISKNWAELQAMQQFFLKHCGRLNSLLLFKPLGSTWLTFASFSSGGCEIYTPEAKAEICLLLMWLLSIAGIYIWVHICIFFTLK